MSQTLVGLGIFVAGLLLLIFGGRLARAIDAFNKWALGISLNQGRTAGLIAAGILLSLYGLLVLLRVIILQ